MSATGCMHAAKLTPKTKPGKIFNYLLEREGSWVDAGELNQLVGTNCLSTHVSAARMGALPRGYVIDHEQRTAWVDGLSGLEKTQRHYYRVRLFGTAHRDR